MFEDPNLEQLITLLIAIASALYAWWQRRQAAAATAEKEQAIAFFDPASPETIPPASVPMRSYVMSDSVKQFILQGHPAATRAAIEEQIIDAEEAGKIRYTITYPGGYYVVEWGQVAGGGRD